MCDYAYLIQTDTFSKVVYSYHDNVYSFWGEVLDLSIIEIADLKVRDGFSGEFREYGIRKESILAIEGLAGSDDKPIIIDSLFKDLEDTTGTIDVTTIDLEEE